MIKQRNEEHIEGGGKIRSIILGLNDGLISTFTLLIGVAAATLLSTGDSSIVILAGIAAMVSGAISMGLGEYISSKSEYKYIQNEKKKEKAEIELFPDEEREEVREILEKWGVKGEHLNNCVDDITSNKEIWSDFLIKNELSLDEPENPKIGAFLTFIAFVIGAFIPLAPYLLNLGITSLVISTIVSFISLFIVGALKTSITGESRLRGGLEMVLIGIIAFIASFAIGLYLEP